MKRILGILVILALALSLNAIVLAENEEILFGFSPTTLTNEYFSAVQGSIEKACEKLNIKLISYDPQGDATTQATQIDDMISMGIQALIYIPIDSAGGRTVMQSCKDAGVFVINIDNVVIEEDRDLCDAVIASNNYDLGYISGLDMVERFPEGGNIVIAHCPTPESCNVTVGALWDALRENAATPDAFKELFVFDGKGDTAVCFDAMLDALEAYDDIDIVYCVGDSSALGVIQAIEESGKGSNIAVYGKDGSPNGKEMIAAGKMVQSSAQSPTTLGRMGVEYAYDLINGKEVPAETYVDAFSINIDNISDYDLNAWE